jgi:hypothetical protein
VEINMKLATCLCAASLLLLVPACKCKPKALAQDVASNPFVGLWEGVDAEQTIYSVRFIDETRWESYSGKLGAGAPYYKGTYTFSGTSAVLKITHNLDTTTMGWALIDDVPKATGMIIGNTLRISALTETDLVRADHNPELKNLDKQKVK